MVGSIHMSEGLGEAGRASHASDQASFEQDLAHHEGEAGAGNALNRIPTASSVYSNASHGTEASGHAGAQAHVGEHPTAAEGKLAKSDGFSDIFKRGENESRKDYGDRLDKSLKPYTVPLSVVQQSVGTFAGLAGIASMGIAANNEEKANG